MKKNISKHKEPVPIFFAVDDRYAPYLAVALSSLTENASPNFDYKVYVLIDKLSEENRLKLKREERKNLSIEFVDVKAKLDSVGRLLHLRDYYTQTTYYRFFIPDLFPQYKRGIYLDCDILVLSDISRLHTMDLGTNLLGAVTDEVITRIEVFGNYAEKVLGVPRHEYFNAGILVMNLEEMRKCDIENKFVDMIGKIRFSVAQDQDYLNVLCHGRIKYLPLGWNKTAFPDAIRNSELHIIHFKINWKPWHYDGVALGDEFWDYAARTDYYEDILTVKDTYTEADCARDAQQYENLVSLALSETEAAEGKYVDGYPVDLFAITEAYAV